MKLIYIHVNNYRNFIVDQGFNLSSEFKVHFDSKTKNLTIKENENFIPGFFGDKRIDVKAIVGENGAGKSSLMEVLLDLIDYRLSNKDPERILFSIWYCEEKKRFSLVDHLIEDISIKSELEVVITKPVDLLHGHPLKDKIHSVYYNNELKDRRVVNSRILFEKQRSTEQLSDISTPRMLFYDYITGYNAAPNDSDMKDRKDPVLIHRISEKKRELGFILNHYDIGEFNSKYFSLPREMVIRTIDVVGMLEPVLDEISKENEREEIEKCIINIEEYYHGRECGFFTRIAIAYIITTLLSNYRKSISSLESVIYVLKEWAENDNISNVVSVIENNDLLSNYLQTETWKAFQLLLSNVYSDISTLESSINIPITKDVYELFELYKKLVMREDFVSFIWGDMSSGEEALLRLYSRFNFFIEDHARNMEGV